MLERLDSEGIEVASETGRPVALPAGPQDVAAIVEAARSASWTVAPHWAAGDGLPSEVIFVSPARMNAVRDVVPEDLMVTVDAGVTVGALEESVSPDGLCWPPGDLLPRDAMLGDVMARLPGGWTVEGSLARRYLLALQAVMADGATLKAGALTVKWVTGYDLRQLLVGSRATLGVLTGLTLRLETVANREAVLKRYRREFENLVDEASSGTESPSAEGATGSSASRDGSRVVLERLKRELDPDGIFPTVDAMFGGSEES